MTIKKPVFLSVRNVYMRKKDKHAIQLLDDNQEMTFKEIAETSGVGLAKVRRLNTAIEGERKLLEFIENEEAKYKRLCIQMDERQERAHFKISRIEELYFVEGKTVLEISQILSEREQTIQSAIRKIRKQRGEI